MKTAIVSTIVNADNVIDSFIKYHHAIGVSHFFFFIDDNSESIISHLEKNYKDICTIIKNTTDIDDEYLKLDLMFYYIYRHKEVMARQILNTKYAMNLCIDNNIDWLLSIDIDELIFISKDNINEVFKPIEDKGFDSVVFHNFEALPEKLDIKDYFKEVSVFKKNLNFLTPIQIENLNMLKLREKYFIGYQNGKSAVRVKSNAKLESVHSFLTDEKTYYDYENIILHYNCCGYEYFKYKYKKLGNFKDKWFNRQNIELPFHLKARDIIRLNNEKLIKEFYIKEVIQHSDYTIEFFINNGTFIRTNKIQDIIL